MRRDFRITERVKGMSKNTPSKSTRTGQQSRSKLDDSVIKNTFSKNFKNEYFTPTELFCACRYGVPFDNLPEEGKQMVLEYEKEYKRCTKPGDPPKRISPLPDDITIIT